MAGVGRKTEAGFIYEEADEERAELLARQYGEGCIVDASLARGSFIERGEGYDERHLLPLGVWLARDDIQIISA